ncbi:hypothetical protein [Oryzobacter terrae]|uniref:hypothetical protein n=1 Tax=Oryzobacter terrae TaxID=1620385 RepID=UPI00366DD9D7
MQSTTPSWLPADPELRVIVSCTARLRGGGPRRLPDRRDAHGPLAAVLVETREEAEQVLRALDAPGRVLALDVERKQDLDLLAVAREVLQHAVVVPTKPNDATVRSLDVLLTTVLGPDLAGLRAAVVGTGNIGLKAVLLLAERNARVLVHGRDPLAVRRTVEAVAAVVPAHQPAHPAVLSDADADLDLLVTAVSADGVVDEEWLTRLRPGALVVDVGIGNLSPGFIAGAASTGVRVLRLDTRFAEAQVLWPAPGFAERGPARAVLDDVDVVSGGWVGELGVVVVDDVAHPTQVVGVADGRGGLVPAPDQDLGTRERVERVQRVVSGG